MIRIMDQKTDERSDGLFIPSPAETWRGMNGRIVSSRNARGKGKARQTLPPIMVMGSLLQPFLDDRRRLFSLSSFCAAEIKARKPTDGSQSTFTSR